MYVLTIIKDAGVTGDKPVLNGLASLVSWLVSSLREEWALRSPAANVNGPTLMLLRERESDEVGPFTGATYRL